jgi:hypothetical protein
VSRVELFCLFQDPTGTGARHVEVGCWRRKAGSASSSIAPIIPFLTVKPMTETGRPYDTTTIRRTTTQPVRSIKAHRPRKAGYVS